jgi:uncharacterized membrane protein YfcA
MSAAILSWIALVSLISGFVQGLAGFGSALIAVPLMALVIDIRLVVPLAALSGFGIGLANLYHLRRHINMREVYPILPGTFMGVPLGVYFLRQMPETWVMLPLALLLMGYAIYSLGRWQVRYVPGTRAAYLTGLLSGSLSGAFSTGGPPVVIYASLQPWEPADKKVLMTTYFLLSGCLTLGMYALGGLITGQVLGYFLVALPLLMLGSLLGIRLYRKLGGGSYNRLVNLLILATGLLLGIKAINQIVG